MMTFTEKLLKALPPPGDPVTIGALAEQLNDDNRRVVRSMDVLRRRGLVVRLDTGLYKLTTAGEKTRAEGIKLKSGPRKRHGAMARKPAPFREALWRALRMLEATTVPDLLSLMPPNVHGRNPESNAYNYLRRLKDAGYVIELTMREAGTAITSNGFKRYRLLNNTGPKAPFWSPKHKKLIDPNLNEEVGNG